MTNFQIYKAEINRLLEKTQTGGGWDIEIKINNSTNGVFATCSWDTGGRSVVFGLNDSKCKEHKRTRDHIIKSAKHEFGHFVVARMEAIAMARFVTQAEIDDESERIARIFERM